MLCIQEKGRYSEPCKDAAETLGCGDSLTVRKMVARRGLSSHPPLLIFHTKCLLPTLLLFTKWVRLCLHLMCSWLLSFGILYTKYCIHLTNRIFWGYCSTDAAANIKNHVEIFTVPMTSALRDSIIL